MPIKKSAYKELRKAKTRHTRNISLRTELKTLIKNYEQALTAKKLDEVKKALPDIISKIDRAASKGVIRKNTASRKISRLMKKLSSAKA